MFGGWSANGRTYAVDFLANKKWEMLYSLREGFVLLNSEGDVIWNNLQVAVNNLRPGLCDIDGDGAWSCSNSVLACGRLIQPLA